MGKGVLRKYTQHDAEAVRYKLSGLLSGQKTHVAVYNEERTLGIVVSNDAGAALVYEFGWAGKTFKTPGHPAPDLTDLALIRISDDWASGSPASVTATISPAAPDPHTIKTREDFMAWLITAKPGDMVVYHAGELARYLIDAAIRIRHLEGAEDRSRAGRPSRETIEVEQLQDAIDLVECVRSMHDAKVVTLTQRRALDGNGMLYCATKLRR